jgi:hypothetical protein
VHHAQKDFAVNLISLLSTSLKVLVYTSIPISIAHSNVKDDNITHKDKCPQTLSISLKSFQNAVEVTDVFKIKKEFCRLEIQEKFANYKISISPLTTKSDNSIRSYKIFLPTYYHSETYDKKSMRVKSLGITDRPVLRNIKLPAYKNYKGKIKFEIEHLQTKKVFQKIVNIIDTVDISKAP